MISMDCIIIEDEPLAAERLKNYIHKLPFLNLVNICSNGVDALVYLSIHKIELIFLDINIGELSGIQVLESLTMDCAVIITTAYQEYALKGFELRVTDYLLKPYTFDRFLKAVERAEESIKRNKLNRLRDFIFIKTEYRLEKVWLNDILFIEGMRDYRRIHTISKKIMTLQTFREFEEAIPPDILFRVHKSYMVAVSKIDIIEKDQVTIGNRIIPVSEANKKELIRLIS